MRSALATVVCLVPAAAGASAQTASDLAAAIERLDGPTTDARAMALLIDAGAEPVDDLMAELSGAADEPADPKFRRILRVLRALGPDAATAATAVTDIVCSKQLDHSPAAQDLVLDAIETVTTLVASEHDRARAAWQQLARHQTTRVFKGRDVVRPLQAWASLQAVAFPMTGEWSVTADFDHPEPVRIALAVKRVDPRTPDLVRRLVALLENPHQPDLLITGDLAERLEQSTANHIVWDAATTTLARIDPDHPQAIRGLGILVRSADDPRERCRAAMSLGHHGAAARSEVEALLTAAESDDATVVAEAVTALSMIGDRQEAVIRRLTSLSEDPRRSIARRAGAALRSLTRDR